MKKAIALLVITLLIVACGPHRMKCGPRGICDSSPEKETEKNS